MTLEGDPRRTSGLLSQAPDLTTYTDESFLAAPALAQADAWIIPRSLGE